MIIELFRLILNTSYIILTTIIIIILFLKNKKLESKITKNPVKNISTCNVENKDNNKLLPKKSDLSYILEKNENSEINISKDNNSLNNIENKYDFSVIDVNSNNETRNSLKTSFKKNITQYNFVTASNKREPVVAKSTTYKNKNNLDLINFAKLLE